MRRPIAVLAAAATAMLAGCAQTFDATKVGVPVTMATAAGQPAQGQRFAVSAKSTWAFWGTLPVTRASVDKVLASQLAGGKGIADLRIRVRTTFGDLLLTTLTAGIISLRSVTMEGTVVGSNVPESAPKPAPSLTAPPTPTVVPAPPPAPAPSPTPPSSPPAAPKD